MINTVVIKLEYTNSSQYSITAVCNCVVTDIECSDCTYEVKSYLPFKLRNPICLQKQAQSGQSIKLSTIEIYKIVNAISF